MFGFRDHFLRFLGLGCQVLSQCLGILFAVFGPGFLITIGGLQDCYKKIQKLSLILVENTPKPQNLIPAVAPVRF